MGCHTWFFKSAKELQSLETEDDDEIIYREWEELHVDEFHDLFRYNRINPDGTYSDIKLLSKDETLQFLIDEDDYIQYDRPKHKVLNTIYAFWEHYPDGLIEFG